MSELTPHLMSQRMLHPGYTARTLPQVIADAAAAYGERVAITDGAVQLTYAGLEKAERIAI